jgi:lysozyme
VSGFVAEFDRAQPRPMTDGARWRRRLVVLTLVVGLVVLCLWIGRRELLPRYRPTLQAGEMYGIDVSNHQGSIDWNRVAAEGEVSFAYIKATEGNDFLDKRFNVNWAQAEAAGIGRGAYHFFTLCSPGAEQAENFLRVLPTDPDALPPAVDLEFSGCRKRPDRETVKRELQTFIDAVEARVGQSVVIYSLPSFEKAYPVTGITGIAEKQHWTRRLFRRPVEDAWTLWQASDTARVAGISGPVDLDVRRDVARP